MRRLQSVSLVGQPIYTPVSRNSHDGGRVFLLLLPKAVAQLYFHKYVSPRGDKGTRPCMWLLASYIIKSCKALLYASHRSFTLSLPTLAVMQHTVRIVDLRMSFGCLRP